MSRPINLHTVKRERGPGHHPSQKNLISLISLSKITKYMPRNPPSKQIQLLKVLLYKTCKIHCPWERGFVVLLGSINASITLVNTHKFLKQIKFSDTAYFKVGMLNKIASALIVNTRTPATWDHKTYRNGTAHPSVCLIV